MTTQATNYSRITVDVKEHVGRIALASPPLNVIDIPMMEELSASLAEIECNPEMSVLVLTGARKAFSAGVDVGAHTPEKIQEMLTKFHAVILKLVTSKKVTIAAVHGHCLGGGAELAMVCDLVYTAEAATWGFPEIKLACYPPVAVTALAALIGQKKAADLILTGRSINGIEAADAGLANTVVAGGELETTVQHAVDRLLTLSSSALAVTKKAMYAWDSIHFDKGLARAEKIYLEELMKTADVGEGVSAFMQKRPPVWKGR
jgi:cyclohexa-1,5-dienecarbonyl-CoA hydratase